METVRFLRDIEDEKKYAQGLELAYVQARDALTDLGNRMYEDAAPLPIVRSATLMDERHKELRHIVWTMGLVIQDCVDRRRRLADVARGLPDVIFDEERP